MANTNIDWEVGLSGLNSLGRALRQLPINVARKHLQRATNAGMTIARKNIAKRAPVYAGSPRKDVTPGLLKESVIKRKIRSPSKFVAITGAGIKTEKTLRRQTGRKRSKKGALDTGYAGFSSDNDAYYWRFLEFGYNHSTPKGKRTYIPAKPFVVPGFVESSPAMKDKAELILLLAVQQEANKVAKRRLRKK